MGHDIHHHPRQQWSYVHHLMPDKILLLKCSDSAYPYIPDPPDQSWRWDEVPFSTHVAVDVREQDGMPDDQGAAPGGRGRALKSGWSRCGSETVVSCIVEYTTITCNVLSPEPLKVAPPRHCFFL